MTKTKILKAKLEEAKKEVLFTRIGVFGVIIAFMFTAFKQIEGVGLVFNLNWFSLIGIIVFFFLSSRLYTAITKKKDLEIELKNK